VVVDDVEDLNVPAAGEDPVSGVGLPALVGQISLEPPPRALGPLVGLGGDKAPPRQHPPNGRDRGHYGLVAAVATHQVVADRVGAGVEAFLGEGLAQGDDLLLDHRSEGGRRGSRPARLRHEARVAELSVAS